MEESAGKQKNLPSHAENKSGTALMIENLKSRQFTNADDVLLKMAGHELTVDNLVKRGFDVPILIEKTDGLGLVVPATCSIDDVLSNVGGDRTVDVIDVIKQETIRMKLWDFGRYFKNPTRERLLNMISLEISETGLGTLVKAPDIAEELDWVKHVWPKDVPDDRRLAKPEVGKYCLISTRGSYTDFHVDFGGSSVWYHLLWGEKIFYLIQPTQENLSLYQRWALSPTHKETFFGDQVEMCYKFILKQGQTMLIPTGWIHAVLTPEDSLAFGGNFLHSLNIAQQLQVYEMERRMKIGTKFLYPSFQKVNWFAACSLLEDLKRNNDMDYRCPPYLLQGLKALVITLKQWSQGNTPYKRCKSEIPLALSINHPDLLKGLENEIRRAETKSERRSKHKVRKPVYEDFVDMPESFKRTESEEEGEKDSRNKESPKVLIQKERPDSYLIKDDIHKNFLTKSRIKSVEYLPSEEYPEEYIRRLEEIETITLSSGS